MEEQIQADNSTGVDSIFDSSDDFFTALDSEINHDILDNDGSNEQVETVEMNPQSIGAGKEVTSQQGSPDSIDKHNYKKRYSDSSSEARRLNTRLTELEPYAPILDAMREDPNLITHVRGYFEGGGKTPVNVKEQLGLDEEFIFDPDEAISDTGSDSAKVLQATVDGIVQKRLSQHANGQMQEAKRVSDEQSFKSRYQMDDSEFSELMQFAKSNKLTLDDVYYLKNRQNKEDNITRSAQDEVMEQMKNVRKKPRSVSTAGDAPAVELTPDEKVFDFIKGSEAPLNELLG